MNWTIVRDYTEYERAVKLARGRYQRNLIRGCENLSGSTLRGRAKDWGLRYAQSRENLLKRLTENGVRWHEETGDHNRRLLVIG